MHCVFPGRGQRLGCGELCTASLQRTSCELCGVLCTNLSLGWPRACVVFLEQEIALYNRLVAETEVRELPMGRLVQGV